MGAWLAKFWTDPVLFESLVRALIKGLGAAAFSGMIPVGNVGWWVGLAAIALGGEIPIVKKHTDGTMTAGVGAPTQGGKR
jgi:hypothetical protein